MRIIINNEYRYKYIYKSRNSRRILNNKNIILYTHQIITNKDYSETLNNTNIYKAKLYIS